MFNLFLIFYVIQVYGIDNHDISRFRAFKETYGIVVRNVPRELVGFGSSNLDFNYNSGRAIALFFVYVIATIILNVRIRIRSLFSVYWFLLLQMCTEEYQPKKNAIKSIWGPKL